MQPLLLLLPLISAALAQDPYCPPPEFANLETWLSDVRSNIQTSSTALPAATACPVPPSKQKVLLIGIDGLRADAAAMLPLPGIRRLQAMGQWSFWAKAQATGSAVSGPGWSSLLTGFEVEDHQVDGNGDLTDIAHPTVLKTVKDALGKKVAASVSWAPLIDDIIDSFDSTTLDASFKSNYDDQAMVNKAVDWITNNEDYDLIFVDFDGVDAAGHGNGFDGYLDEYQQAVIQKDAGVSALLDAIATRRSGEEWLILLTTDHGGKGTSHGPSNDENKRIPLLVGGNSPRIRIGPAPANDPGSHLDILPTIHHFFGIPIPEGVDGQVFGFKDYNRTAPPVCVPSPATCGCPDNQQVDYRGTLAVTESGRTCQAWSSQSPHSHDRTPSEYPDAGLESNYCRNPDGEDRAWCYTTDPDERWELCAVPDCPTTGPDPRTEAPAVSPTDPPVVAPTDAPGGACAGSNPDSCGCSEVDQADYRGDISVTVTGKTCQKWTDQSPHAHTRTADNYSGFGLGNHNHCRNPDGEPGSWCYTTDPDSRWELCDVPTCPTVRHLRTA